jgi:hypothetical protein
MMNKYLLIVGLAVALSGCASTAQVAAPAAVASSNFTIGGGDPIQQVATFTVADLQAADADAVSHNDKIAHTCYPALIQFVQSVQGSTSGTTVIGAISAFQRARDVRNGVVSGVPDYLTIGCGPLYAQVHGDLLSALAQLGVTGLKLP